MSKIKQIIKSRSNGSSVNAALKLDSGLLLFNLKLKDLLDKYPQINSLRLEHFADIHNYIENILTNRADWTKSNKINIAEQEKIVCFFNYTTSCANFDINKNTPRLNTNLSQEQEQCLNDHVDFLNSLNTLCQTLTYNELLTLCPMQEGQRPLELTRDVLGNIKKCSLSLSFNKDELEFNKDNKITAARSKVLNFLSLCANLSKVDKLLSYDKKSLPLSPASSYCEPQAGKILKHSLPYNGSYDWSYGTNRSDIKKDFDNNSYNKFFQESFSPLTTPLLDPKNTQTINNILCQCRQVDFLLRPLNNFKISYEVKLFGGAIRDILLDQAQSISDLDIMVDLKTDLFMVKYEDLLKVFSTQELKDTNWDKISTSEKKATLIRLCLNKAKIDYTEPDQSDEQVRQNSYSGLVRIYDGLFKLPAKKSSEYPIDILVCDTKEFFNYIDIDLCKCYLMLTSFKYALTTDPPRLAYHTPWPIIDSLPQRLYCPLSCLSDIYYKCITINCTKLNTKDGHTPLNTKDRLERILKKYPSYHLNPFDSERNFNTSSIAKSVVAMCDLLSLDKDTITPKEKTGSFKDTRFKI